MKSYKLSLLAASVTILTACGGGGGGSSSSDGTQLSSLTVGIEIPSEISAVPADNSGTSGKVSYKSGSFAAAVQGLSRATSTTELSTTSDYAKAEPSVYVEERALEQFEIIEEIFQALEQTNYADEENINNGPYKAMIAWEEEQNGKEVKTLETWTVESQMIITSVPSDVTGNSTGDVNRLYAWVPETNRETGQEQLIKAEFLIYTAPDKAADGSLLNYGEWDMNVLMNADPSGVDTIPSGGPEKFFAASARIGAGGTSILKVHEKWGEEVDMGGMGAPVQLSEEMKGILYRDGTNGYGQVSYPDWDACWQWDGMGTPPCESGVPTNVAKYAYNTNYLGVQEIIDGVAGTDVYKDRDLNGAIRLVHRYALFYADADTGNGIAEGDKVNRHVNFGFPVSYEQSATENSSITFNDFGYYGAWQGRHQLWVGGDVTATTNGTDGTTFNKQDVAPGQTAPTFKLKEFNGTFTKRSMVDASLDDIKNVAVETWLNDNYEMFYFDPDGAGAAPMDWQYCTGYLDWSTFNPGGTPPTPPTCRDKSDNSIIAFVALHGTNGAYDGGGDDSELLAQLPMSEGDRRYVNISKCDEFGCFDYLYLTSDPGTVTWTGAGFYEAQWGASGMMEPVTSANQLAASEGEQMWVNIGGSIYVAYNGDFTAGATGWVQKALLDFDEQTWTPTFDDAGDISFTPERGMQYYMHANGQNYVVTRTDAGGTAGFEEGDYSARLELQIAATPVNTDSTVPASILPAGTAYLAAPWDSDIKYTLVEDPTDPNYLLLVVAHDASGVTAAGTVASEGRWGLVAYADPGADTDLNAGTNFADDVPMASDGTLLAVDEWGWVDPNLNGGKQPVEFNYEAANEFDSWGKQQFLIYASNPPTGSNIGDYVILSDPISLNQVGLYDNLGNPVKIDPTGADVVVGGDESNWKKVNMQFDGWMHGLPDMYHELQLNGWTFTPDMASKIRRLKEGQLVSDGVKNYFVKPMETSLFLGVVGAFPKTPGQPDISAADAVNLGSVPDFTAHNMGASPTTDSNGNPIVVKYSEGKPVE